ncbi:MAG TPA: UDP-glucose 4-epimerase GalE [Allosphingosinicella sp.]|nr:UDP-glucose 4-epimerase GalE [Allosphingosinicella sp.]
MTGTTMPPVLVTGGAGYIGSHTAMRLAETGFQPIVFDNLSNGHRDFVRWGPFEEGDIRDGDRVRAVLEQYRPCAIIHFAALIEVGESVRFPERFYEVNVGGAATVLAAARRAGIDKFVFSSTCATYGTPQRLPMDESHVQAPLNPYGHSKLMVETMLRDMAGADEMRSVLLRYFNAAGASAAGLIGEDHEPETHAIPLILDAVAGRRPGFAIFGSDYPTRDGTAERDYVHVEDLAEAHVLALRHLLGGGASRSYNVGTGRGTTVRELIAAVEAVTGRACPVRLAERRDGDAAALVAEPARLMAELGWRPTRDLHAILGSAWKWHRSLHAIGEPA